VLYECSFRRGIRASQSISSEGLGLGASGIRGGSEPDMVDRSNLPRTIIVGKVGISVLMKYGGDMS
jgi:hypothetical protein